VACRVLRYLHGFVGVGWSGFYSGFPFFDLGAWTILDRVWRRLRLGTVRCVIWCLLLWVL
jgi:hypothetical protein